MDKSVTVKIALTAKDLYAFSLRHTYTGFAGIFGIVISVGAWVLLGLNHQEYDSMTMMALFIIGLLFTVVQPVMLWTKSCKQAKNNKNVADSLEYTCDKNGILVTQGDASVQIFWIEVRKVVESKKRLYIHMSPVRAFIFPKEQCKEQFKPLVEMVNYYVGKVKSMSDEEIQAAWDEVTKARGQMEEE